jgi:hypothetical protein
MTTKTQMVEIIKAENPEGLRVGNEQDGYVELTTAEYNATIANWAEARLAKEAKIAEQEAIATAKAEAVEKLIALGLNPKAFGL